MKEDAFAKFKAAFDLAVETDDLVTGVEQAQIARKPCSVTQRVKMVRQPYGGYIPMTRLTKTQLEDGQTLGPESVSPPTVGMAVDYMTRFVQCGDVYDAFSISMLGALRIGEEAELRKILRHIKGLDDESIRYACMAVHFDGFYRAGLPYNGTLDYPDADAQTCANIRTMVERTTRFFERYGPVVSSHLVFPGGYSDVVRTGDGDFMTSDTLWDIKVSKNPPSNKNTLQLAMYFLMAKRSAGQPWWGCIPGCPCDLSNYANLTKIGIFNPRLNAVYQLDMGDVDEAVIRAIEKDVLVYDEEYERKYAQAIVDFSNPTRKVIVKPKKSKSKTKSK